MTEPPLTLGPWTIPVWVPCMIPFKSVKRNHPLGFNWNPLEGADEIVFFGSIWEKEKLRGMLEVLPSNRFHSLK